MTSGAGASVGGPPFVHTAARTRPLEQFPRHGRLRQNGIGRQLSGKKLCFVRPATPKDKREGREKEVFAERDRKLCHALEQRRVPREAAQEQEPAPSPRQCDILIPPDETETGSDGV